MKIPQKSDRNNVIRTLLPDQFSSMKGANSKHATAWQKYMAKWISTQ